MISAQPFCSNDCPTHRLPNFNKKTSMVVVRLRRSTLCVPTRPLLSLCEHWVYACSLISGHSPVLQNTCSHQFCCPQVGHNQHCPDMNAAKQAPQLQKVWFFLGNLISTSLMIVSCQHARKKQSMILNCEQNESLPSRP